MIRFIVAVITLGLVALVVALNQTSLADLNLLGLSLKGVPTISVALFSFGAGVVATLAQYLSAIADRRRRKRIRDREQALDRREQAVTQREAAVVAKDQEPKAAEAAAAVAPRRPGWAARLLGRAAKRDPGRP